MAALLAFIVGYIAGAKTGPQTFEELRKAWDVIAGSKEAQDLIAVLKTSAQALVQQDPETVAKQVQSLVAGKGAVLEQLAQNPELADAWKRITQSREVEMLIANGTQLIGAMLAQSAAAANRPTPSH